MPLRLAASPAAVEALAPCRSPGEDLGAQPLEAGLPYLVLFLLYKKEEEKGTVSPLKSKVGEWAGDHADWICFL